MLKNPLFYILAIFILTVIAVISCFIFLPIGKTNLGDNNMKAKQIIRQPAVAGSFYPASSSELQKMVDNYLTAAGEKLNEVPRAIIVPHAGYVYSGPVAAKSFKQLVDSGIKRAIIIGPSHHFPISGLYLSGADLWQTPLGQVKLSKLNQQFSQEPNFSISDQIHAPEHALEIELPFLQTVVPGIEIIPIVVGELDSAEQTNFAMTLGKYLDQSTVIIVSVDLSHYHPYDQALKLDQQSIDHILKLDDQKILTDEIDAPWAVGAVLELARQNGWQAKLLKYANSGDVTGDKSAVVGYSAIGFYGPIETVEGTQNNNEYTDQEKKELLGLARTTIEEYLKTGRINQPATDNPKFKEKRGAFVTLNKNGQLRGCIGYIQPIKSLIESVRDNAISAAVDDNRFSPVEFNELKDIEIEISILTVPKPDTLDNIIKNQYGVVLQKGNRGATYLPQVWEDLADPDQFFSSLCLKGGLSGDCYSEPETKLYSYQAIVFHE